MTTTTEQTATEQIQSLRAQIVESLSRGESTIELETKLKDARAAAASSAEVDSLRGKAEQIRQRRERAARLVQDAKAQSEAIDCFLAARDAVIGPLLELLPKAVELVSLQNSATVLRGFVDPALAEFLPPGFTTPVIAGKDGVSDCHDRAAEAVFYLRSGCGLLQSLQRENRVVMGQPARADDHVVAAETGEPACSICAHPERASIDRFLYEKRPLRSLEEEFGVSRSSLSRHRAHMRES